MFCLNKLLINNLLRLSTRDLQIKALCSFTKNEHYDIIIAGGGMVGTTLACTLGKNKRLADTRILLLEGSKNAEFKSTNQYSNRVVALNPNTNDLLNRIGAWQHIAELRFGTAKKLQVWDAMSDAMIAFSNDNFDEIIAYIVENDLLINAVKKEAATLDNVKIEYGAQIKEYVLAKQQDTATQVIMDSSKIYTCDLLLGCDGANSRIRQSMGINYLQWNYNQMGVVATLELSGAEDNVVAWQRFLPAGPIALLPLKENLSSLVWSTSREHAKSLLQLPEEQFVDAVNEAIWTMHRTDGIVSSVTQLVDNWLRNFNCQANAVRQLPPSVARCSPGSRAAFPLGFGHATNYVSHGVVLVGDAAHRVHPLAGQGVNLGFGDVSTLNRILGDTVLMGNPLALDYDLKIYESERQRHNVPTMLAVDGLHKLYTRNETPFVLARSVGLQLVNAMGPLKKALINQAAA